MKSKQISILGSTGSIGKNALKVIEKFNSDFSVKYLTANSNGDELIKQALHFRPEAVGIIDKETALTVEKKLSGEGIDVLTGREGLLDLAGRNDVDLMLNGLVGGAGMEPTYMAVKAGVNVALSNKESLVMAGDLISREKERTGAEIYPVDSEHSAIWQCIQGENTDEIRKIILTGSGGPFRTRDPKTFEKITIDEALKHPNWSMGRKITIDSATMMNKGLEVIEAFWLFDLGPDKIEIIVHPQSIIHSMVEFNDGSIKAQLGVPDMKIPIQYALTYPRHANVSWEALDLVKIGQLTFEAPDLVRFPSINLAFQALKEGGSTPAVLNLANDFTVALFLNGKIGFMDIPRIVEKTCATHNHIEHPTLKDLLEFEQWVPDHIRSIINI